EGILQTLFLILHLLVDSIQTTETHCGSNFFLKTFGGYKYTPYLCIAFQRNSYDGDYSSVG
ncbi:MAG: hypothetical protein ACI3X8_00050, partial [Alloprevotella sp.]